MDPPPRTQSPRPLKVEDITPAFVDAVRVWGRLLTGNLEWGWATAGAQLILVFDLDYVTPSEPPTQEELESLAFVATLAAEPGNALRQNTGRIRIHNLRIDRYVRRAFGGVFDSGFEPAVGAVTSFEEAVRDRDLDIGEVMPVEIRPDPDYWDGDGLALEVPEDLQGVDPPEELFDPTPTDTEVEALTDSELPEPPPGVEIEER